jgi:hypothetical protein
MIPRKLERDEDTSPPTIAPTSAPNKPLDDDAQRNFGLLFLFCIVAVFILWRLYARWRLRRQQRLLDIRYQQASQVLGDMQLVPNEDIDDGLI